MGTQKGMETVTGNLSKFEGRFIVEIVSPPSTQMGRFEDENGSRWKFNIDNLEILVTQILFVR